MSNKSYFIAGKFFSTPLDVDAILSSQINDLEGLSDQQKHELASDAKKYIDRLFAGKTPVPEGEEKLHIRTMGPPISGSTTLAKEIAEESFPQIYNHNVLVAYDENGAIECFSAYLADKDALITDKESYSEEEYYAARLKVRDRYRNASQIVRDLVMAKARQDGLHIIEDTTGSSDRTVTNWRETKDEGYTGKTFFSYVPLSESLKRIRGKDGRFRNLDINEELIAKRFMVLANLPRALEHTRDNGETFALQTTGGKNKHGLISCLYNGIVDQNHRDKMLKLAEGFTQDIIEANNMGYFEGQREHFDEFMSHVGELKNTINRLWPEPKPAPSGPVRGL